MSVVPFRGSRSSKLKSGLGVVRGFPPTITLDAFAKGYVDCALWESYDGTGRALGLDFAIADIAASSLRRMAQDCTSFQSANRQDLIASYGLHYRQTDAGRDFWLSRNRRQGGFGSRPMIPERVRANLTQAAQAWTGYVLVIGLGRSLLGPD